MLLDLDGAPEERHISRILRLAGPSGWSPLSASAHIHMIHILGSHTPVASLAVVGSLHLHSAATSLVPATTEHEVMDCVGEVWGPTDCC
jgi:hypothetical protein